MVDAGLLWQILPRPLREFPADLAAVVAIVTATTLVVSTPVLGHTALRVPLGLAFVLFVPGYAFIAALFPEDGASPAVTEADGLEADGTGTEEGNAVLTVPFRSGIDGLERVALSFGLSIAIVPLLGLVLNATFWGLRPTPIVLTVTGFTLLATAVAAVRRWQLPVDERFQVPYRRWYATSRNELFAPDSRADAALNVVLVASILLAVGSVGYAVTTPAQGEQFSAIYLLTEDDDGDLIADDYPTDFEQGGTQELVVGVDNHEHRPVDYTVVVVEQVVSTTGNETVVEEQRELERLETQLAHDETWHYRQDLEPTLTGEDVRIVWLLYPDEVPAEPSMESTDYHVHLWADVGDET